MGEKQRPSVGDILPGLTHKKEGVGEEFCTGELIVTGEALPKGSLGTVVITWRENDNYPARCNACGGDFNLYWSGKELPEPITTVIE